MQIMKALSAETKTFSAHSSLTGLRGGNLLFHLQKLMDSGMILQRNEIRVRYAGLSFAVPSKLIRRFVEYAQKCDWENPEEQTYKITPE